MARSVAPHNHLCLTLSLVLEIPPKMIRMCQFMTCPIPRADISGPPVFSPWPPPLSLEKSAVLLPHRSVLAPLLYFFTQGSLSLSQVYCSPSQTFTQMSERGLGTDLYCSSSPAIYRKISAPPNLGSLCFKSAVAPIALKRAYEFLRTTDRCPPCFPPREGRLLPFSHPLCSL